jgi:hypothetical protein
MMAPVLDEDGQRIPGQPGTWLEVAYDRHLEAERLRERLKTVEDDKAYALDMAKDDPIPVVNLGYGTVRLVVTPGRRSIDNDLFVAAFPALCKTVRKAPGLAAAQAILSPEELAPVLKRSEDKLALKFTPTVEIPIREDSEP